MQPSIVALKPEVKGGLVNNTFSVFSLSSRPVVGCALAIPSVAYVLYVVVAVIDEDLSLVSSLPSLATRCGSVKSESLGVMWEGESSSINYWLIAGSVVGRDRRERPSAAVKDSSLGRRRRKRKAPPSFSPSAWGEGRGYFLSMM